MGISGLREVEPGERAVIQNGGDIIGTGGLFFGFEIAEMERFVAVVNPRLPATIRLAEPDPFVASRALWPSVPHILGSRRRPKIDNPIIVALPVSMINIAGRHFAVDEKPCKPRREIMVSPKYNLPIAIASGGSSDFTDHDPARGFFNPSEDACVGIVRQVVAYFGKAHEYNNNGKLRATQALEAMI